jgi:hypothetical protein
MHWGLGMLSGYKRVAAAAAFLAFDPLLYASRHLLLLVHTSIYDLQHD